MIRHFKSSLRSTAESPFHLTRSLTSILLTHTSCVVALLSSKYIIICTWNQWWHCQQFLIGTLQFSASSEVFYDPEGLQSHEHLPSLSTSLPLPEISGRLTRVMHSRAALPIPVSVCSIFVCPNNGMAVSVWDLLAWTQMSMHAIAHGGCTDVWVCTENWLWEKNPFQNRGLKPA